MNRRRPPGDTDDDDQVRAPRAPYSGRLDQPGRTSYRFPGFGASAEEAYRYVHDRHLLDGNARLNLASFVTTWMEPEAEKLMSEAFPTNAIDHDEYPSTSAIETACVAMVADLLHAPGLDPDDPSSATGVSTIGSSEAVMLAGLALKWRWRARRRDSTTTPNLVLGTNVQVVWEKFCRYFDVEPRYLPLTDGRTTVAPEQVPAAIDDDTIGVVALLGTTFTGEFEDVAGFCEVLDRVAGEGGPDVPVHVDAASGGFVAPFLDPDLLWDFRLPRVASINVSGHKYGLTYPGIGFALWRDRSALPQELIFHVNYLGGDMPTFTLNFSRPGSQIIGQYYTLFRLGREGFTQVMSTLRATARWLGEQLLAIEGFDLISDGSQLPVLAVTIDAGYTVHDVSHELRTFGWQVPAYALPRDANGTDVLRIVLREGFSGELAEAFVTDLRTVVDRLGATGGSAADPSDRPFAH